MKTLYVENIPDDVYAAIRAKAKKNRTSIAAEVLPVLTQNFPTDSQLEKRRAAFRRMVELRSAPPPGPGPFPSAEEMIREIRDERDASAGH